MDAFKDRMRKSEKTHQNIESEFLSNMNINNTTKERIKEIIETRKEGSDNDGVLRDILFSLKELNLKRP